MCGIYKFDGRVAVVTGGARGIGMAITRALIDHGADVHVFDVAPGDDGGEAPYRFHKVDIADSSAVAAAVSQLPDTVSLLVNNAGITRDRSMIHMSDDEWQSVLSVNLTGAFNVSRALAPAMRKAGYGRIVNITSINGIRGKFGQANYCASKAGLIGLTKTLARELGPKGVTVNAVAPGMVMTEMALALPPEFIDRAKAESVLPELATPEDVAHAVLFLLSDAACRITGEVIRVDAGQYI
jgi:acetoacetyl-CoA reductase/3-oxoacyl-[acyl-carrier protein] reductase